MKHKRKIALLSVATVPAVITLVPDTDVQATEGQPIPEVSGSWVNPQHIFDAKPQRNTFKPNAPAATIATADSASVLSEIIHSKFKEYETSFSIKYKGKTANLQSEIDKIIQAFDSKDNLLKQDNTYYTAATISRDYTYSGYVNDVTITFTVKYHTTKAQESNVDSQVKSIIEKIIKPNMSQFEKVKAINDYIVTNSTYSTDSKVSPHSAYALLSGEKKGVSQAYALLAYRLLNEAKMEAYYVTGTAAGGNHAWNLVRLGNYLYHLDTAWNEPVIHDPTNNQNTAIGYQYFLITEPIPDRTVDSISSYHNIATTYDHLSITPIHEVINPIKVGNMLYYAQNSDKALMKLDLSPAMGATTVDPTLTAEKIGNVKAKDIVHDGGWLYFSNLDENGNGFLYKIKIDGTELTVLTNTYVSDLKINGTTLEYLKADGTKGSLELVSDITAIGNVMRLINKFANSTTPDVADVIIAETAYKALSAVQKAAIENIDDLLTAIKNIEDAIGTAAAVMLQIARLDETAATFKNDLNEAVKSYKALSDVEKAKVTNKKKLTDAQEKQIENAEVAFNVNEKISQIISGTPTYYADVKAAIKAYNALTLAQRESVTTDNKLKLKNAKIQLLEDEKLVFNINYQIRLINDQSSNFETTVKFIRAEIDKLSAEQKTLITDYKTFTDFEDTLKDYGKIVEALEKRIGAITPETDTATLYRIQSDYQALNLAQQAMVSSTKLDDLMKAIAANLISSNTAEAVQDKIDALDVTDDDFIDKVTDARNAYNAFINASSSGTVDTAKLIAAEQTVSNIKEVIAFIDAIPSTATNYLASTTSADTAFIALNEAQKHVTNKNLLDDAKKNIDDANAVSKAIAALSETSTAAELIAVRTKYNALAALPKELVKGLEKLKELELANNTATAADVKALIDAIDIKKPTFVADVNAAYAAFEKLSPEQKALIDEERKEKLTDNKKLSDPIDAVIQAIDAVLDTDPGTYKAKATIAIALFNKLNDQQRALVPNALRITDFTTNINAANAVIQAIDNLKASSSADELTAVEAQYTALSELQRKLVTNISKLEDLLGKEYGKEEAEAVIKMIDKLDETKKTFAVDVKRARDAYDKLSEKQKTYVTNYEDLLAAEKKVADLAGTSDIAQKLIAQIAAINNTSASFKTDVEAAKSAYAALPEEQQALINNYNVLKEHLATYDIYAAQAKKLEDKINALSDSSPGYQAALAALQSEYNAFNAAQKAFVPEYAVKLLNAAQSGIDAVRNVTSMILALNQYKITFHADVANARAAYNALIKNHGVYLAAYLEEALERAEALVEKDKTAARKVVNAINSLSSDSIRKEIDRARRVYNNLTALQRPLVTNLQTLIDFETGKLSYNTSGIPDGVDTDDKNTDTEETNPLPDFAAIPGERTAMTKSKGDTYSAQIYVSDEVGNSERFVLTTRANVTAIIPPTVTVVSDKTGTMAIEIQATSSRVSFKATMGKKPVTFATEVDIILESVPKNSTILRVDQFGNRVPATYSVDGDQYTIKTNGSDTFIITRSNTTFTDIQNDSHREYIEELAARNIIQNDGNGKFNPNQNITRAEFAVMMARALDIQPSTDTNFNDIRGKSYESEVQALYEIGIIQGVNSTTFNPNSNLTRQQAAMMVERMLDYVNVDTNVWESPQFTDDHLIADSAINAVALMQSLDIVSGKADGSFDPLGKLTRSQLAKILYKALQSADLL